MSVEPKWTRRGVFRYLLDRTTHKSVRVKVCSAVVVDEAKGIFILEMADRSQFRITVESVQ